MAEPLRAFFAICRASSSSPNIVSRVVSTSRESRAIRTAIRTPTKYTGPSHTNPTLGSKKDQASEHYSTVIYMNDREQLYSILVHIRRHSIACKGASAVEEMSCAK